MAKRGLPWDGGSSGQDDWALLTKAFARDGVIYDGAGTAGRVTPGTGRQVQATAHRAWVYGVLCESTAIELFNLDSQASGSRTDVVAWKVDRVAHTADIVVLKSASTVPAATLSLVYLPLARVTIVGGATSFAQSAILDLRQWANIQPRGTWYRNVATSVPTSTTGTFNWTPQSDPFNLQHPSDLTAIRPTAGTWDVKIRLTYAATSGTTGRRLIPQIDGAAFGQHSQTNQDSFPTSCSYQRDIAFDGTQSLTAAYLHNHGSSVALVIDAPDTFIAMHRIGD